MGEAETDPPPRLWRALDVLVMALFSIAGVIAGFYLLRLLMIWLTGADMRALQDPQTYFAPQDYGVYVALAGFVQSLVMIGVVWAFGLIHRHHHWIDLWVDVPTTAQFGICVRLFLVVRAVALLAGLALAALGLGAGAREPAILASFANPYTTLLAFVIIGFLVPLAEEIFFRGVLYRWLRDRWGRNTGMIVSSMIFGVVHFELTSAISAFIYGLALAWIYERLRSLWSSTLVHALNNITVLALLYFLNALGVSVV
jgi:uncharacterized protein